MGPQRDAAVRYLSALVSKYREDIAAQRRALAKLGSNFALSGLVAQLQALREDAADLLARLRGRSRPGDLPDASCDEGAALTSNDNRPNEVSTAPGSERA